MALRTLSLDPSEKPISISLAGRLTCRCPINGRMDYATVEVAYIPTGAVMELEAFARYLDGFSSRTVFHETVTQEIAEEVYQATEADDITVRTRWDAVEGIACTVVAHR
ncbi:MAG TPA: GTP cyclohydrolase I [Gemmatimonadales bacterium]|nr:GTP cyclohydrolase I [Gemmatimonadales bacterium]